MPNLAALIAYLMVAGLVVWALRMYIRDARTYRAGRGDERYAWLRRSQPDHPALPPVQPRQMLRVLPPRLGWRHLVICLAQASAIFALTWLTFQDAVSLAPSERAKIIPYGFMAWTILVAFGTAVLTRLWDFSVAALVRRRTGAGEHQEPVGEADGVLAPRRRLRKGA